MNTFIHGQMGNEFSAKDFRTWRLSCYFMGELMRCANEGEKSSLKSILEAVSEKSGNTPAILQSSYVHPGLVQLAKDNDWKFINGIKGVDTTKLLQEEKIFLDYLATDHATQSLSNI